MTTSTSDAKDLITLAERMGIPVDEAMRQVAHLIADEEAPVEAPVAPAAVPVAASIAVV